MTPNLIGLGYQKHSGKDTVANLLTKLLEPATCLTFKFADALKQEVSDATGNSIDEINNDKERFRPLLQWWGTEFRRHEDTDYWIKKLEDSIRFYNSDYKIIADIRFQNEANWIKSHGGILIEVRRFELNIDKHSSEQQGHDIKWDEIIYNNKGLEHLELECRRMIHIMVPK